MTFTIIATVGLCYLAAGIYILLIFDHADNRKGYGASTFASQFQTVIDWPRFLYFIANEDEILIVMPDDDLHL